MNRKQQSIMLGSALFATLALWPVETQASVVSDPEIVAATATYLNAGKVPLSQIRQPYSDGYKAGYAAGHSAGRQRAHDHCEVLWGDKDPVPGKEGAYWKGYREGYQTAFDKGYDEGHRQYCHQ